MKKIKVKFEILKSVRISHSLQHAQDVDISGCLEDKLPNISCHINLYFFPC